MADLEFEGETYNDDRMFVLSVCRCTVDIAEDGTTLTTIYHESAPPDSRWCLVTYRNTPTYPAYRVDHFDSLAAAQGYLAQVEPTVPRISLGGDSPAEPLPYAEWVAWKAANGLKEFNYRTGDLPEEGDAIETLISKPGQ
jgi:hypothetical protein